LIKISKVININSKTNSFLSYYIVFYIPKPELSIVIFSGCWRFCLYSLWHPFIYQQSGDAKNSYFVQHSSLFEDLTVIASWTRMKTNSAINIDW